MANRRNNPKKNRALRKRVRVEKQKIRHREKKHKPKKWVILKITIEEYEVLQKLEQYAKEHKISKGEAIRRIIRKRMELEKNGIQEDNGRNMVQSTEE